MNSDQGAGKQKERTESSSLVAIVSNIILVIALIPIVAILESATAIQVSYVAFIFGGSISALNLLLFRRLIETLFAGNGGLISIVVSLCKLPVLLFVLYFVSLRGPTVMLWCIIGLLTLAPSILIAQVISVRYVPAE
jgi:hypothetical protein